METDNKKLTGVEHNGADNVEQFIGRNKSPEQLSDDKHKQLDMQKVQLHNLIEKVGDNIDSLIQGIASYTNACAKIAQEDYATGEPNLIIRAEESFARLEKASPQGWVDISNLDLRRGLMTLRRALYQTTSF